MRIDDIKSEFEKFCTLKLKKFEVGTKTYEAYAVDDIEKLFDEMIELADDHPDVVDERLPYWGEVWPSSLAMAEYLQTADWIGSDMSILELGCGPGVAGLGAAEFTTYITVSDYEEEALELAELNWLHAIGKSPKKLLLDWRDPQDLQFDVILAADVAYEKRFFEPLINTFKMMTKKGGSIILTEPGREIAGEFFELLKAQGWKIEKSYFVESGIQKIDIYRIVVI